MKVLFLTEEPITFPGMMVRRGRIHVRNVVEGLRERSHDVHLVGWNDAPERPYQHSVAPRLGFGFDPSRTEIGRGDRQAVESSEECSGGVAI